MNESLESREASGEWRKFWKKVPSQHDERWESWQACEKETLTLVARVTVTGVDWSEIKWAPVTDTSFSHPELSDVLSCYSTEYFPPCCQLWKQVLDRAPTRFTISVGMLGRAARLMYSRIADIHKERGQSWIIMNSWLIYICCRWL